MVEIKSAQEATKVATTFLKQYYFFLRPVSAAKQDDTWIVKIDVGLVSKEIAEVKIDTLTSEIIEYSFPK